MGRNNLGCSVWLQFEFLGTQSKFADILQAASGRFLQLSIL